MARAPRKNQVGGVIPIQQMSGADPAAQAIGGLGRAVGQSSDILVKLNKEQEGQYMTDAEIILRRESTKLSGELALNNNPSEHFGIAQKRFSSLKDSILKKNDLNPRTYDMLSERIDMFSGAKLEQIGTDAKLMQVENGRMLSKTLASMDAADGNYAGANQINQNGVDKGQWPQEYKDAKELEYERMARNDLYQYKEDELELEYFDKDLPGLSDGDRKRIRQRIKAGISEREKEDTDSVYRTNPKNRGELVAAIKNAPHMSKETGDKMLKEWDKTTPLSSGEVQSWLDKINGLEELKEDGSITDVDYRDRYNKLSQQIAIVNRRDASKTLAPRMAGIHPDKTGGSKSSKGPRDPDVERRGANWLKSKEESMKGGEFTEEEANIYGHARDFAMKQTKNWLKDKGASSSHDEMVEYFGLMTTLYLDEDATKGIDLSMNALGQDDGSIYKGIVADTLLPPEDPEDLPPTNPIKEK